MHGSEMLSTKLTWSAIDSSQKLAPNLKYVEFTLFSDTLHDGDALMEMLESRYTQDSPRPSGPRAPTAAQLEAVYLNFIGPTTGMHALDWGRLYELAEGGLEVTVKDDCSRAVRYAIS